MSDSDEYLFNHLRTEATAPPFTPRQVAVRYRRAESQRRHRRRVRLAISGIALAGALLGFLFLNLNGELGPGFLDPTLVRAATPFPTLLHTPEPVLRR